MQWCFYNSSSQACKLVEGCSTDSSKLSGRDIKYL